MTSIKINRKKKYKNLVVTKPWGSEYIACENNTTATWLLKIKKNLRENAMKNNLFNSKEFTKNLANQLNEVWKDFTNE